MCSFLGFVNTSAGSLINASATVAMGVYVAWKTSGDKNELKQEFNERLATLDKDLRAEMKILDENLRAEMKGTREIVQGGERCVTSGVMQGPSLLM